MKEKLSYFQVAGGASLIENRTAHLEGAEGNFDPPVLLGMTRPVWQPEETRSGTETMLETYPRPQSDIAT
jgi:hypothetical protein